MKFVSVEQTDTHAYTHTHIRSHTHCESIRCVCDLVIPDVTLHPSLLLLVNPPSPTPRPPPGPNSDTIQLNMVVSWHPAGTRAGPVCSTNRAQGALWQVERLCFSGPVAVCAGMARGEARVLEGRSNMNHRLTS